MIGPILKDKIAKSELQLPPGVSIADFETMYTLLLMARRVDVTAAPTEAEEKLVLGVFCKWQWPYKPAEYSRDVPTLLSHFRGIATNVALRAKFMARISPLFIATDADAVVAGKPGGKIHNIFTVLRKARSRSIKRAAYRYRTQGLPHLQLTQSRA